MKISTHYTQKPFPMELTLMKGNPADSNTWKSIGCTTETEFRHFLNHGWRRPTEFLDHANDARKAPR